MKHGVSIEFSTGFLFTTGTLRLQCLSAFVWNKEHAHEHAASLSNDEFGPQLDIIALHIRETFRVRIHQRGETFGRIEDAYRGCIVLD